MFSRAQRKRLFFNKIDISDGPDACHPWLGCTDKDGYGKVTFESKDYRATHIAWFYATGSMPEKGAVFCHSCDNPICCNVRHLFIGTHKSNAEDRTLKGRGTRGESVNTSRLTELQVRIIRYLSRHGISSSYLSDLVGVSHVSIRCIVRRKTWKHVRF